MTAQTEPYSRFYWRFTEEFPAIYDDKLTFGWWMTLLVIAEGAHPSPAHLPRSIPRKALDKLTDALLVELVGTDRFRVRGVTAERTRRSESARAGGIARHRSANAEQTLSRRSAHAEQTVSLDETRRDEQRQDETRRTRARLTALPVKNMDGTVSEVEPGDDLPPDVDRLQHLAEELTGRPYVMGNVFGGLGQKAVDEQLRPHRWQRVEQAWRQVAVRIKASQAGPPTLRQLILGADDLLNPIPSGLGQEAAQNEEQRRYDRRVESTQRRLREMESTG